jgi:hypothetical protein
MMDMSINMKKTFFIITFILSLILKGDIMAEENVFLDDPVKREITEKAIAELNQNSYLGYDFLSPWDENIKEKIQIECNGNWIQNYMSRDYYGDNIKWIFSGYPHDECSSFLTEVSFSSNKYNVFGIKPGDDISNALDILKSLGFENNKRGDLQISFDPHDENNSEIEKITIEVKTYYLGNRLY